MKSAAPISNKLSLFITVAAAAGFFFLLMLLPNSHTQKKTGPLQENTAGKASEPVHSLFVTRCTQCHALPDLTHRSEEDWKILVLKMNRYMKQTGRLSLTDDQATILTRYILQHQKQSTTPP